MSAPRKRFEEHSARWQREQRAKGIDPKRWNRWLTLRPETRRGTDVRKYAGHPPQSVRDQKLAGLRAAAVANMLAKLPASHNEKHVRRNVLRMSPRQLRFASKASGADLQRKASREYKSGNRTSPFFYN